MNRIDRLLGYLLMFHSRDLLRAQDFAAEFEISERTVYRDIQALCEVGVPIMAMPGEGYRLMEGYYLPPVMFSQAEARALSVAVEMFTGLAAEGETKQAARLALEKIRAILPKATLAQIEALQAVIGFYTVNRTPLNLDDKKFVQLQQAVHQRRVVHLRYHALHSNDVTERDVEPLHLGYVDHGWILTGYCRLRQEERHFRLERIDRYTVKTETFMPRRVFVSRQPGSARRVLVRVDADSVRWVREAQHFTFTEELPGDDAAGVVMVYHVESLPQIQGWLLSWGDKIEVLEPPQLRTELARIAATIAARHR
ncbi:MAG: hypothetical protein FOGNACKC_01813 [Anaerolineae bacterium]|nr:hypothetical protein [Anaerolineae bacterium]